MTTDTNSPEPLNQQLERYIGDRQAWLQDAVELTTGSAETPIEQAFAQPSKEIDQARRDTEDLDLTPDTEDKLREIAGRFGIGGETDVTLAEQGFTPGHVNVFEGGLTWKIKAEAELAGDAGTYIFAGSPYRATKEAEHAFEAAKLGSGPSTTEYEAAQLVAESLEGYEPLEAPVTLPFGYDINNNFAFIAEPTGQFIQIGTKDGKPVVMLRVDRENLPEGTYKKQPDTAALMGVIADVLTACGDEETSVGVTTSNTYASRAIDAVRAGITRGRHFGVAMYGRETIARVKGEATASPTEIFQIPGELRVMHDKLQTLKAQLEN